MQFSVGDRVDFIDDHRPGVVKAIKGDLLHLKYEDGFEEWVQSSLVVKKGSLTVSTDHLPQKDTKSKGNHRSKKRKERGVLEVDLHIETLLDHARGLSNHEIVNIQLNAARKALEQARKGHFKALILIHGLGDGKLRREVHEILNGMEKLEFFDASYDTYGGGATEVRFY